MNDKELLDLARKVRENAFVPYTKFKVGAAILGKSGKIYTGCNYENIGIPALNLCAERSAAAQAVSEGEREFEAVAVVGSGKGFVYPCGVCRQLLVEFNPNMKVITSNENNEMKTCKLISLLPEAHILTQREYEREE